MVIDLSRYAQLETDVLKMYAHSKHASCRGKSQPQLTDCAVAAPRRPVATPAFVISPTTCSAAHARCGRMRHCAGAVSRDRESELRTQRTRFRERCWRDDVRNLIRKLQPMVSRVSQPSTRSQPIKLGYPMALASRFD